MRQAQLDKDQPTFGPLPLSDFIPFAPLLHLSGKDKGPTEPANVLHFLQRPAVLSPRQLLFRVPIRDLDNARSICNKEMVVFYI